MVARCDPDEVFFYSVFRFYFSQVFGLVLITLYANQTTHEGSNQSITVMPYRNAISAVDARGM